MSVYTPPALNAVDFALSAFTPADVTPYESALSAYTPPALNAVDFALITYALPQFNRIDWELLPGGFPTQFSGFKVRKTGSTIELCMVATTDAPVGMGGSIRLNKNGTTYAVYLVETSDGFASPVRIRTTTGTKAVRLKT